MASEEAKEKLERLRSIRGAQRGIVTKNVNKANAIFGDEAAQAYISSEQVQQLEVISRLLEAKLKTLEEIDQQVLSLCILEEITQEIEESEKYVEKAINCQKKISDVSRKTTGEPQESNPLAELIQALPGTVQPALPTNQVKAKLPN